LATKRAGKNVAATESPYAAVVPTTMSVFMLLVPWRAAFHAAR